jgi:hypothetical protein
VKEAEIMAKQPENLNRPATPQEMLETPEFMQELERVLMRKLLARSSEGSINTLAEIMEQKLKSGQHGKLQHRLIGLSCGMAAISIVLIALGFLAVLSWGGASRITTVGFIFGIGCLSLILINAIFAWIIIKYSYQATQRGMVRFPLGNGHSS